MIKVIEDKTLQPRERIMGGRDWTSIDILSSEWTYIEKGKKTPPYQEVI